MQELNHAADEASVSICSFPVDKFTKSDTCRITVQRRCADAYTVRSMSGDSARIFIQEEAHSSTEHWGHISVISSFGNFGYTFSNTGPLPLKRFLTGLEFSYLIGKFFGLDARVFDLEASLHNFAQRIKEAQSEDEITAKDARRLLESLKELRGSAPADAQSTSVLLSSRMGHLWQDLALWESFATRPNPQAIGFWEEIWAPFVKELKKECNAGTSRVA